MIDYGTRHTDLALKRLEARLRAVYRQAERDIAAKTEDFWTRHKARDEKYRQQVKDGKLSKEDYEAWQRGQVFQGDAWNARKGEIQNVLYNADATALQMINDGKVDAFAANANYMGYAIEHGENVNFGFSLYDGPTMARLLKDNPQILPKARVKKEKAYVWYNKLVNNCVLQGIIQGESIADIADRIGRTTGERTRTAMLRNARTAYTGAQNAGRIEGMRQAQKLGVNVKKRWMATLDARTRDAHADLDGQIQETDKPFKSPLGDIMFPGDPTAKPGNVYNCRCTLTYVYPEYPSELKRRDNESGEVVGDMTYREWEEMKKGGGVRILETIDKYPEDERDIELDRLLNERDDLNDSIRRLRNDIVYAEEDGISEEERNIMVEELSRQEKRYNEIRDTLDRDLDSKYKIESVVRTLKETGVEYVPVQKMDRPRTESAIINAISGGDMTDGSCASLSLCYTGQKAGYDVYDFRGGISRSEFSTEIDNILKSVSDDGVDTIIGHGKTSTDAAIDGLSKMEPDKEYIMSVGEHTTIVRMQPSGGMANFEYLELQSGEENVNGWHSFGHDIDSILTWRFGTTLTESNEEFCFMADVESLGQNSRFQKLLGYINTNKDAQIKGIEGHER